jgi:ABC-type lipoprotein release transport system permease subunit
MEGKTVIRIPALPFGLMYGAISAVIGLIIGIFLAIFWTSLFSFMGSAQGYTPTFWNGFGLIFGLGAIVMFPTIMFVSGLVQGLIIAVLYNFLAPRIGGIKLYFQEELKAATPQ